MSIKKPSWSQNIWSVFWLEISYWEKLLVEDKKITIPNWYKNLDTNIWLWLALCLKWLWGKTTNLKGDNSISEFEAEQIAFVSKLIYWAISSNKTNVLFNPKKYTDAFLDFLAKKLATSFSPINSFLAEMDSCA